MASREKIEKLISVLESNALTEELRKALLDLAKRCFVVSQSISQEELVKFLGSN